METGKIYQLMPVIMKEIGSIGKDRKNTQQNYSFRGIDDVYNAVNASLAKNGVFCVPEVLTERREERQTKNGGNLIYTVLSIRYTFFASDGSSVSAVMVGEAMDSGDKSANKAMSTAQKYAFFQIFCIPTEEQKDTEYETHEVKPKAQKPKDVKIDAKPEQPKTSAYESFKDEINSAVNIDNLKDIYSAMTVSHANGEFTKEQYDELIKLKDKKKGELQ